ncbi:hypothetical protein shim_36940 [Shimia sp. SK013]|uniref:DUF2332 domain-containing protein n=1 Tax=Shimia sp. SK013 TaxID=1389006 RepID=UPI0006B49FD4|nr:DUF2332 family protein [Shimia sp. SK013]KPA20196.1 hypothetical protein shim_36940 [Shimia sp. SK013]
MSAPLRAAFLDQAGHCDGLGSPFMVRLLRLLSQDWPEDTALAEKSASFTGDIGPSGHSLPLRIASGLHALVLQDRDAALAAVYPPHSAPDALFGETIKQALHTHDAFLCDWIDRPPQTNEVRRSAVLIAAAELLHARFGLPFQLSELGASAGLNLMFDRFDLVTDPQVAPQSPVVLTPKWTDAIPTQYSRDADSGFSLPVTERRGVDLTPLNAHDPADALRLLAYLWPDQTERLTRTRAAIELQDAPVDKGDAIDWLQDRLQTTTDGQLHLIYHTVAWQYFPAETQARGTALIGAAGAKATDASPLAWLSYEADNQTPGAALTLRLWPGDLRFDLGRADFHGRWIDWRGPAALT